jgi:phage-related protein (TIGR01555 family)
MGVVRNIYDGLQNLVTGLGTRSDARMARSYASLHLAPQQIEEAYEASPSLRKAISITATDRIRAWRDWQATKEEIKLIEAEEERLQLQAKTKQAEILRGLGGGALILVAAGDPALPINITGKQGLVAINVVTRWHLTGEEWDDDLASPTYGEPKFWTINGTKTRTRIHPSRVVCFRGEPLPSLWRGSDEDRYWGRGRVPSLIESAQNLDEALATFAAMIKDSLNVDIGVSKLLEILSTPDGEANLMKRLGLMVRGSSVFNGKLYDLGDENGKGGEKLDRRQVTWTGIPEIMRGFAEAFCAAADIPFTRFWGTSAKGLNATGEGDANNWRETVETGQKIETKPCLDQVDAALIPSALGSRPPEIWWQFAPLNVPTETEETTRFKTWTEAMDKVSMSGAIPEAAFNEAYQNGLVEAGWLPGLDAALEKVPETERFGGSPEPDDGEDPSAIRNPKPGDDPEAA